MRTLFSILTTLLLFAINILPGYSQEDSIVALSDTTTVHTDTVAVTQDSLNATVLLYYQEKLGEIEKQQVADSLKKLELEQQLNSLKTSDNLKKEELLIQLEELETKESKRIAEKKAQIERLRQTAVGYPVMGILGDTLFFIYNKIGASTPQDRATNISKKIRRLYDDDFMKVDSIRALESENTIDIIYEDIIIMSVSESDALWVDQSKEQLATSNSEIIKEAISEAKRENSLGKIFIRIGLVILVIAGVWGMIWLIRKGYSRLMEYSIEKKDKWLKDLSYKDYTFLTADQELKLVFLGLKVIKWFFIVMLLYLVLPLVFSIFPFTRGWGDKLFGLIWSPFKRVFIAIWDYLPNVFTILVIYLVMRYFVKFVKYIFSEIKAGKLKVPGFHADWAMPTFNIVRFLLYAFMFVLIFPYLPGSDSAVFQGVSVFIGILFSLGSSSAIANMIAGLVITYMRPFKIGDRIRLGEMVGDVVEKNMLVTRLRTIKNEEITIPNASILSGNTINYSTHSNVEGLIIHSNVTIGYDVPWKDMHQALIDAALRTNFIQNKPSPFVLQTSLDDFYVSYQINAYTQEASKQAIIYSELHQHIQDVCNERGIEIMSPHYRAERDGNLAAIPKGYLPKDYKVPHFNVKIDNKD